VRRRGDGGGFDVLGDGRRTRKGWGYLLDEMTRGIHRIKYPFVALSWITIFVFLSFLFSVFEAKINGCSFLSFLSPLVNKSLVFVP